VTHPPAVAGRRAITGLSDTEDQALAMITALASELAVARERIDTLERLLEAAGVLDRAEIERFIPADDAALERDALRRRLVAKIFRPLRDAARRALSEKPA